MQSAKCSFVLAILIIAVVVAAVLFAGCGQKQAELEELKAAYERTVKLYNAGGIDTYFENIHDDVVYNIYSFPSPLEGKTAVRKMYDEFLSQADSVHWVSIDPKFKIIGSTGIIWSTYRHSINLKDRSIRTYHGRHTVIFTKSNGKWLKIFEHTSPFPTDEPKSAIHREFEEAWNKGNVAVLDEHIADDFIRHSPPNPDVKGLDGLKEYIANTHKNYSEFHTTIEEIIVEGNSTLTRFTINAVRKGDNMEVTSIGTSVDHWENGKDIERWVHVDMIAATK